MAAFDHAVSLGFRYLETDVHLTADGILVAFHDADLERVAGLTGTISDQPWDVLREIDLGDGHHIPTMDELFSTFPNCRFNIDPKADATVGPLGDLIELRDAVDRVGIGAFDDARIGALKARLGPDLCTSPGPSEILAYLSAETPPADAFADHGCLQIPPRFGQFEITAALVAEAHDRAVQVHVWTINEEAEMHRLLDLGVDALMTDDTALLKSVLEARGAWIGG